MTAGEQLASALEAGGPRLALRLSRTEDRLAEVADGHGEALGGYARGILTSGGKRLRPLLVFLCAGEPKGADDHLIAAGAAVELLHMATLVHDDVLDQAPLRRGAPTVFAAAGRDAATATGDLLFSRAFAELAATESREAVQALSLASSDLARGELVQRADAWNVAVTVERYRERCLLKTASLFVAACRLGALLGGADRDAIAAHVEFGERLGIAFQIFDDVLDVSGSPEAMGKRRGADLIDGTVTLPLIEARRRDSALAELDLRGSVGSAADAAAICDRIVATGALDYAREEALRHVDRAKQALERIDLAPWQREALQLLADGVVARYS